MMPLDAEVIMKLLAVLIALVAGGLRSRFEKRPKLISYLVHASAIPLHDQNNSQVNTHSIVVRNAGKLAAHNVRIGHHFLPPSYQIFPPVSHTVISGSNNSAEILIPVLVPNDQISISYLYFPPITVAQIHAYAKSDEGLARIVKAIPRPEPSMLTIVVSRVLLFLGASTAAYWAILLLTHVVTRGR